MNKIERMALWGLVLLFLASVTCSGTAGLGFVGYSAWGRVAPYAPDALYTARVAKFAWEMDRLYDSLPDVPIEVGDEPVSDRAGFWWGMRTHADEQRLSTLAMEIVPWFSYNFPGMEPVFPSFIAFIPLTEGQEHRHILGRASCEEDALMLNYGYANLYSPRFRHVSMLATLTHELAHLQGICSGGAGFAGLMEARNEVATTEVLASMCASGNSYACKPFVSHLRNISLSFVQARLRRAGMGPLYRSFMLGHIYTDPDEQARAQQAWRFWDRPENTEFLDYIIINYGERAWWFLSEGLANKEYGFQTTHSPYYPTYTGAIAVDDTAWLLDNLDILAAIGSDCDEPLYCPTL